jgi:hypothetical protein
MISPKGYRVVTNLGMVGIVGIMGLGVLGMTGCAIEGDTYSGVVTNVDCSSATASGGLQNCGSGTATDDHNTDNSVVGE